MPMPKESVIQSRMAVKTSAFQLKKNRAAMAPIWNTVRVTAEIQLIR